MGTGSEEAHRERGEMEEKGSRNSGGCWEGGKQREQQTDKAGRADRRQMGTF